MAPRGHTSQLGRIHGQEVVGVHLVLLTHASVELGIRCHRLEHEQVFVRLLELLVLFLVFGDGEFLL